MADKIRFVAGGSSSIFTGLTWATCGFTLTDFNSLASGSCVVASTGFDNATDQDLLIDLSFSFVVGGTTLTSSIIAAYLLPLNQDGSTYGDGTATGSALPAVGYHQGQIAPKVGVTSGNAITGTIQRILLPPGAGKLAIGSVLGVALNSSASAAVKARVYTYTTNG